ncbi:MAG: hypothetical protein AB1649_26615 [Chloroflexota bacterium]
MTTAIATQIASTFDLSARELYRQALISFLHEKRRQVLHHKLEILARYQAESVADLEARITEGTVSEHPAWEDLIVAENLSARLEELDGHVANLQRAEDDRAQRVR